MKTSKVLLVSLALAGSAFAQAPASDRNPVQLAQAGGSARGAGVPEAAGGGAVSTIVAVVAIAIAGAAAAASNNSTATTPSHH